MLDCKLVLNKNFKEKEIEIGSRLKMLKYGGNYGIILFLLIVIILGIFI